MRLRMKIYGMLTALMSCGLRFVCFRGREARKEREPPWQTRSYDTHIIGGGAGGAMSPPSVQRKLGSGPAVVEREHLGGHLLSNWGLYSDQGLASRSGRSNASGNSTPRYYGLKLPTRSDRAPGRQGGRRHVTRAIAQRMNGGVGLLMKKNKG